MNVIRPRKTVIEVRFRPSLSHFQLLDKVGSVMLKKMDVTDWERSPFSVEIQDRKNHERVSIEVERLIAEFDSSTERQENAILRGISWLNDCLEGYEITTIQAIGIRQWFAIVRGSLTETKLISKIMSVYFDERFQSMAEASSLQIKDFAITLDLEDKLEPRKTGRLVVGAMSKGQWVKHVNYNLKPSGHVSKEAINSIVRDLPNDFIYIDLDLRFTAIPTSSGLPKEKLQEWGKFVFDRQKNVPAKIISDL